MIIDALAMQSPRVRAAVHRHDVEGAPLVPLLREAHRLLLLEAAALLAVAGAPSIADPPAWPDDAADDDSVTEAQLLALVVAADQREVARGLVTRPPEVHSASMLPRGQRD